MAYQEVVGVMEFHTYNNQNMVMNCIFKKALVELGIEEK